MFSLLQVEGLVYSYGYILMPSLECKMNPEKIVPSSLAVKVITTMGIILFM